MKNTILILDKIEYKNSERIILSSFPEDNIKIYYTEYEDDLIRKVCKWKFVGEFLLHVLYWLKSYRYARQIFKENRNCKVICINPIVGIFMGMMNNRKKMQITLAGFLFEPKKNRIYYLLRKIIVSIFLKGIDKVIVYAKKEVAYYEKIFGVRKFVFVKYGIDFEAHKKYVGQLPDSYIFSGGRSNRDFHTLIEAFNIIKNKSSIELCIATRPVILQNENTDGIIVLKDVVLETFGSAMEKAKFVVLPLIETEISAGHQVLLEALERSMIVIVNRIEAVEDYVSDEHVVFYNSGDIEDLVLKLSEVIDNYQYFEEKYANNNKFYRDKYTFLKFLDRLMSA